MDFISYYSCYTLSKDTIFIIFYLLITILMIYLNQQLLSFGYLATMPYYDVIMTSDIFDIVLSPAQF